jgi:Ca-activated chloride channel homolog
MFGLAKMNPAHPTHESTGGRLVSIDGRPLPLKSASLKADASSGIARVVLEQRFANPYPEPLRVTYLMPLPADGAVSGYAFRIGDRRIVGEVDRRETARERFEQAIVEGRSAALLEQDRSSLFTQEIGNIPPGAEVVCELTVDQRLRWLDEGAWEWRFPTVVAPRYQGAEGRVPDVDRVTVDVADNALTPTATIALTIRDLGREGMRPESPSHSIATTREGRGFAVSLAAEEGARLDRDIVVRWSVAAPAIGLSIDTGRPEEGKPHAGAAYGLLTVVPPAPDTGTKPMPRDLVLLLDTSGSMGGEPLEQAKRVAAALVDTLTEQDSLEMIEFSNSPRRWKKEAVPGTAKARQEAIAWIRKLDAGGGTEMQSGVLEALRPLDAESQRQVVLITDGLIGFEQEILAETSTRLPKASRLHTVGIGSAVNRSLTAAVARAGRGTEVVIGLGEDAERAVQRLVARTKAPLVVDLEISGTAVVESAPRQFPDLYAGSPVLVGLKLRPEGGEVRVQGRTPQGTWQQAIRVEPIEPARGSSAVVSLFGRESVEDLEVQVAAAGSSNELDRAIERIGLDFQISTRLTSWVAVSADVTVDPQAPARREKMPQELPYGMSIEGLGLRASGVPMPVAAPHGAVLGRHRSTGAFAAVSSIAGAGGAPPPPAPMKEMAKKMKGAEKAERREMVFDDISRLRAPAEDAEEEGRAVDLKVSETPSVPAFRGRIVYQKGREVVIEVTVTLSVDWKPESEVEITLEDGSKLMATIVTDRSTRHARIEAEQIVRLVIETATDIRVRPRSISVRTSGGQIQIEL